MKLRYADGWSSGDEMTSHSTRFTAHELCVLYLYLVVSIKKRSMGKKIHPEIKASFLSIEKQSNAHGKFLIFHWRKKPLTSLRGVKELPISPTL